MPEHDRDACGIVCRLRKGGRPTHGTLKRTLEALVSLGHRGGEIRGEGDGAGVLIDLPRELWAERLERAGKASSVARTPAFFVAHLLIPRALRSEGAELKSRVRNLLAARGLDLLLEVHHPVSPEALGPRARDEEPEFWQVAGLEPLGADLVAREANLDEAALEVELLGLHPASLSTQATVYKVHGAPSLLPRYYPDLRNPECRTSSAVGHSRYSTNTLPTVLRAQPFGALAHNGEINTIERLRRDAVSLGLEIPPGGSDSQDLDRILRGLVGRWRLSLFEAVELLLPPVHQEILHSPEVLRGLYATLRRLYDTSAQGPAALICRLGTEFVFSVDALGLRPLWLLQTAKEVVATSEAGVVPIQDLEDDPKPLAPGEKVGAVIDGGEIRLLPHPTLQREILARFRTRLDLGASWASLGLVRDGRALPPAPAPKPLLLQPDALEFRRRRAGWSTHDLELLEAAVKTGGDPVGSLGWDGPLAALDRGPVNVADFLHEDVAVVTNPAIDPKREGEHFSTRVRVGPRIEPGAQAPHAPWVSVETPLLLGAVPVDPARQIAAEHETALVDDVVSFLGPARTLSLSLSRSRGESTPDRLAALTSEAKRAVEEGTRLLLLEEDPDGSSRPLDPLLALAAVDSALREARRVGGGPSLRRRVGIVVVSDFLRNLHDVMCCLGLGADAVAPALLWQTAWERGGESGLERALSTLAGGIRTVISTMGIHEVAGYGRIFSALGLSADVAGVLGVPSRGGGQRGAGLDFGRLDDAYDRRASDAVQGSYARPFRFNARIAKLARGVASGDTVYSDFAERLRVLEREHPVALRHAVDLRAPPGAVAFPAREVDTSVGIHAYPLFLCPMSFGSQGEVAFRAYAEAARQLRIPAMNGEGGELPDMLGGYRGFRSQQVASGRFGVHAELLNSVDLVEIKIGQGAKPGEGGHLPGSKVTFKVARARNALPGVTLISPSNHHDIYSIEDLAQIVEELRMINPSCRISVKVPVVSGIATVALGIAKTGANVIVLSGCEGGTGAARLHALRRVGLPVEVGIAEVHRALSESGMRPDVELWADGGLRSALDAVKCLCLGADRVGFGTWALLGLGCILCRSCHLDVCPRGISTQIETKEEAKERGLRRFEPLELERAVESLVSLFGSIGEEMRRLTGILGFRHTHELVGRTDLLVQARETDRLDLAEYLRPPPPASESAGEMVTVRRPLSYLTRVASQEVLRAARSGGERISYEDDRVLSSDRAMGTHLSGEAVRSRPPGSERCRWQAGLQLGPGSVPGNGLGAFNAREVEIRVQGGSQDGVAKCARGGLVSVLKGENHDGRSVGGCVGKGFAYGAQEGLFIAQGDADSRCGVRLSGADVIVAGRMTEPRLDSLGFLADRANLKGFAFEYMTGGRGVVLGDPGPWLCSGMTGGVVYVRLDPDLGLTREAVERRLAVGSPARIRDLDDEGVRDLEELLSSYARELRRSPLATAETEARWVEGLLPHLREVFVALRPDPEEKGPLPETIGD